MHKNHPEYTTATNCLHKLLQGQC